MDRVRFIAHQSRRILLIDLTNCSADEVMKIVGEVQRIVTAHPVTRCSPWATSRVRSSAAMRSLE
jgi:hypothetical protein